MQLNETHAIASRCELNHGGVDTLLFEPDWLTWPGDPYFYQVWWDRAGKHDNQSSAS